MQGGEAYSIKTGKPYDFGAPVAGWRPGQGPNAGQRSTDKTGVTCGSGTVLQGSTCVSDANSAAGKVRDQRLSGLLHGSIIKQIIGYVLFIAGDLMVFNTGGLLDKLQAALDIGATLATNILPLIGQFFSGDLPGISRLESVIMWGLGGVETVITAIKEGNWWVKTGATLVGQIITNAVGGPIALVVKLLWTFVKPIAGNLLDIAGHTLLAWGLSDYAEYLREENMPIQDWCTKYGGCPSGSS